MRKSLAVSLFLIVALCATGAFASQPLGGTSLAEPGKMAFSAGYFYSEDKWDSNTFEGDFKIKTNTYYGQFSYGLADGWDMYLRAGANDVKGQGELELSDHAKFFGGLGMHGRLYQKKDWNLELGPVANFSYYSEWKDSGTGVLAVPGRFLTGSGTVKMKDHYSFDLGFGFRWTPLTWLSLYGGPFYHYEDAKLDVEFVSPNLRLNDDTYFHPKKSFGSRFGVSIPFTPNVGMQLEGQFREYFSGGGQLSVMF
jgi:hypothetical protein